MVPTPAMTAPLTAVLTGPTATGKTSLAQELASSADIEIVNADSLLFYRGMDIGTAKPQQQERLRVPHHLLDIREPHEAFTAADFRREAIQAIDSIEAKGRRAIVVGGSGFYVNALLYGVWEGGPSDPAIRQRLEQEEDHDLFARLVAKDPRMKAKIHPKDRYRVIRALEVIESTGRSPLDLESAIPDTPDPRFELWVVDREPEDLEKRIEERTHYMLEMGLLEETRRLLERYSSSRPRTFLAVGYRQAINHLEGNPPPGRKIVPGLAGLSSEITLATRQLARKQRMWFRDTKEARHFVLDRDRELVVRRFNELYLNSVRPPKEVNI